MTKSVKTIQYTLLALMAIIAVLVLIQPAAATEIPGTAPSETTLATLPLASATSISPVVTEVGKISWSIDGLGVYPGSSGIIQVEKPAGATVRSAYMAAATTGWHSYLLQNGDIKIDGVDVIWTSSIANAISSHNYWADVTPLVKAKIDAAPAGRIDFTIDETTKSYDIDGELLVVIFDDPAQTTDNTVALMFGAQQTDGDNFNIGLADPIDLSDPNLALEFSLASSFSYQLYTTQYSIVTVNGITMTSSAGGNDDSNAGAANGNLFTVGGLDDSIANPSNPNYKPSGAADDTYYDDELYSLLPFVANGDTQITVQTVNPSDDDNLLFAGLFIRSATAVVGQGIILSPASAVNPVGTSHQLVATVQDDNGEPVVGKLVTFTVTSGPHAGLSGAATTGNDGKCSFSYTGTAVGIDTIIASFMDDAGQTITSNQATKEWTGTAVPEFPSIALPLINVIGLLLIAIAVRRIR